MLKKIIYSFSLLFLVGFLAGCQSTSTSTMSYDEQTSSSSSANSDVASAEDANVIYFDFDSSDIRADQAKKVDAQVKASKTKSVTSVTVEGHTDEIGTVDYNIALGERRASIVKDALISKGVKEEQVATVTYGKSRLSDKSGTSEARQKNRRTVTVIK